MGIKQQEMADKKWLLDKIKALFDNAMPTAYKLADGTDVTISLLDIGGDFSMGGSPAPEGTYTLMDGSNVTVDSTGKITAIDAPQGMAATEYSLADGTKVTIDKLEVGGAVMQGEAPIANGDYTLEDGTEISVADGLITAVEPKTALAADPEPVQMSDDHVNALIDARVLGYKDGLKNQFKADFAAQEDKIAKQQEIIDKQATTQTQILELMLQLADVPAADPPIDQKKGVFSGLRPNTKKTALEKYAEAAKKLNDSKLIK